MGPNPLPWRQGGARRRGGSFFFSFFLVLLGCCCHLGRDWESDAPKLVAACCSEPCAGLGGRPGSPGQMICFLSADEGCEDLQGVPKGPATNLQTLVGGPAIRLQEDPQSTCKVRVGRCCKFQVLAKHFARGRPNLCPPGRSLLRGDGRPYPPWSLLYARFSKHAVFACLQFTN